MNRIDDIIVFSELTKEELSQIVDLMLKEVIKEAEEKKITLTVTDKMKEHILEKGYNTKYGACLLYTSFADTEITPCPPNDIRGTTISSLPE